MQAFTREDFEVGRYQPAIDSTFVLFIKRALARSYFAAVISFLAFAAFAGLFWFGGSMVIEGEITAANGGNLVIDAVGAEVTRRMAVELLRPGGRAVFIGLHDDDSTLGFHGVVRGQIDLQGSYAYTAEDFEQALGWLVEGKAGIGNLPPVLPLEDGPGAFADLVKGPSDRIKVFLAGEAS